MKPNLKSCKNKNTDKTSIDSKNFKSNTATHSNTQLNKQMLYWNAKYHICQSSIKLIEFHLNTSFWNQCHKIYWWSMEITKNTNIFLSLSRKIDLTSVQHKLKLLRCKVNQLLNKCFWTRSCKGIWRRCVFIPMKDWMCAGSRPWWAFLTSNSLMNFNL